MTHKNIGRFAMAIVTLGAAVSFVAADEVVHFTNGAEMTIRSHVVANEMLKLDLGGNNTISFPIAMVGKIVSAGQDVFLNPVYYPANQALAASMVAPIAGSTVADMTSRGGGAPAGLSRQGSSPGRNGVRLGEAADGLPAANSYGLAASSVPRNPHDDMETAGRQRFDPLRPLPPGGVATIEPTQVRKPAPGMTMRAAEPLPRPGSPSGAQNPPPQTGQPSEPPSSGGEDSGGSDSGNQDPPPSR